MKMRVAEALRSRREKVANEVLGGALKALPVVLQVGGGGGRRRRHPQRRRHQQAHQQLHPPILLDEDASPLERFEMTDFDSLPEWNAFMRFCSMIGMQ